MAGCKGGEWAAIQPRMRLDLPPGGFLRPAGSPAADSSAGGVSPTCPGALSCSALFSEEIWRNTHAGMTVVNTLCRKRKPILATEGRWTELKACDMHYKLTHVLNWTLSVLQKRRTCLLLDFLFLWVACVLISLTVTGVSAEWLRAGFPPLLKGADGSPQSTPEGFPPGKRKNTLDIKV